MGVYSWENHRTTAGQIIPRLIRGTSSCFPGRLVDNTRSGESPPPHVWMVKPKGFRFRCSMNFPWIKKQHRECPSWLGSPDRYRMTFPVATFCYQDLPCELMATQQTPNSDRCSPANLQGSCLCCCFFLTSCRCEERKGTFIYEFLRNIGLAYPWGSKYGVCGSRLLEWMKIDGV